MTRVYPFTQSCRHRFTPVFRDELLSAVGYQLSAKRLLLLLADRRQPKADSPKVVALRIELSATALSEPSGQPVLDYRDAACARFGSVGLCAHLERKWATSPFFGPGKLLRSALSQRKRPGVACDTGPLFPANAVAR
jgi:hypothetical protein